MTNEPQWPVITKVEVGTLMGRPALHLHYAGDPDQFPDEITDSAKALVKEIWPNENHEPHITPVGANVCLENPEESAPSIAISLDDAVKYHVIVFNGELHLDY
jgi:hypothetical protein